MTRKTIIVFTLCCLFVEMMHSLLFSGLAAAVYSGMGFQDYQLSLTGISCYLPETWMQITRDLLMTVFHFTLIAVGFWLSKRATTDNMRIAGALLFYAFISGMIMTFIIAILTHRFPFMVHLDYEELSKMPVSFFGNFYVFRVFETATYYLTTLLFSYWAYRIVFKYWPVAFRKMVFTWGLGACAVGWIMWYLWLGPLIY